MVHPGVRRGDAAALARAAERARPVSLHREQLVPVLEPLAPLLPDGGLRRGSVVAMAQRPGATSVAIALAAAASAAGGWTAFVGHPDVGLAAVERLGVHLERCAVVVPPDPRSWATVAAALVDAVDVVVLRPAQAASLGDARRLAARARERGAVLLALGDTGLEADVRLACLDAQWDGLGDGHGHLRARRIEVESGGRRAASRTRRIALWLPGPDGAIATAAPTISASRPSAEPLQQAEPVRAVS